MLAGVDSPKRKKKKTLEIKDKLNVKQSDMIEPCSMKRGIDAS